MDREETNRETDRGFILIVARNNLHLTKQTVQSALAQDIPCTVVVVDNASTDGTSAWLAAQQIIRISLWQQKSLAYCWNDGLQAAWVAGYRHALVLNNDVVIRPDTYRLLLAHGGLFVSGVSVDAEDRLNYPVPPSTESPHPDFSCFLIRKETTDRAGWFNEDCYPAYVEDCFYHVAMHRAGIRAVSIDLPFLHHRSSTLRESDPGEKARIERGAERNRDRFREKYGCRPGTPEYEGLFTT